MSGSQLDDVNIDDGKTKVALISAAIEHFAERGFESTSVRDIIGDAGQNISSIKYHFGSKGDSMTLVSLHARDGLNQRVRVKC